MTKGYIAGPMTGYEDHNIPAFKRAAELLRLGGRDVIAPHECIEYNPDLTWADYLKADIRELCLCDTVFVLDGWAESKGATFELLIAVWLDMRIERLHLSVEGFYLLPLKLNKRQALTMLIGAHVPAFVRLAPYDWNDNA